MVDAHPGGSGPANQPAAAAAAAEASNNAARRIMYGGQDHQATSSTTTRVLQSYGGAAVVVIDLSYTLESPVGIEFRYCKAPGGGRQRIPSASFTLHRCQGIFRMGRWWGDGRSM